jgi:hypothetical protein
MSAFYVSAYQRVNLPNWNMSRLKPAILAAKRANSATNLMPDFLAVKSTAGPLEWAVAEAKGDKRALASLASCPSVWKDQVRNVSIQGAEHSRLSTSTRIALNYGVEVAFGE